MFRAILATQWKWTRAAVLLTAAIAFVLPLVSYANAQDTESTRRFIDAMQRWGDGYSLLAAATGLLVAMSAWQHDHQGRHVYALSLPVTRARYVGLRLLAGAVLLLPTVVALLAGALVVAFSGGIPDGLHAYPFALMLRFAFAAAVAYAIFFAVASATPQTAGVVLGVIVAVLFAQYLLAILNTDVDIIQPLGEFIFARPGLLSVFSGRWMLIDV